MASLQLAGVSKQFGSKIALRAVDLNLPDGGFTTILGAAGAGKTTMLRVIAGVEDPDAGDIRIGDQLMNRVPAERRNLAMVFENYALYPNMSVAANLAFPLKAPARANKLTSSDRRARIEQIARILEIDHLLERRVWQLSGGQRQRVALGRALVRRPDVFLLDEPIAHLDAKLRFQMRAELKRLQKEVGVTTLLATPDYAEAMAVADTVVVLRDGVVQQVGDPETVFKRPANRFVAFLVGEPHMNLMPMRAVRENGRVTLVHDAIHLRLPDAVGPELMGVEASGGLVVGIRASDLRISAPGPSEMEIPVRVVTVEPRGSTTVIVFKCGPTTITAKLPGEVRLSPEDVVCLDCDARNLHFFRATDGSRVDIPAVSTFSEGLPA